MMRDLTLRNYRGFQNLTVSDLGRINLIVGTNNAGKTSLLEAVELLVSNGDVLSFWATMSRRGEDFFEEGERGNSPRAIDIRHLFYGHVLQVGSEFCIQGSTDQSPLRFTARIKDSEVDNPGNGQLDMISPGTDDGAPEDQNYSTNAIELEWSGSQPVHVVAEVSRRGGVTSFPPRRASRSAVVGNPSVRFVTASSISPENAIMLFEEIVLTPEEDLVIQALNIIEPGIERIATSGGERWRMGSSRSGSRGGLLLKCKDVGDRIPIGSLGDGIWRLLGLALALVRSADGVVLIDEIDTGLHYSVMEKMWSLVAETARRLNIQVFATTHSRDCYESLGVACRSVDSQRGEITIQRLEKGKQRSTVYYEPEIRAIRESRLEQNRFEVR